MNQCGKPANFLMKIFEILTLSGHIRDCLPITVGQSKPY